MADGFDIHLDERLASELLKAAKAAGVSPEAYALSILGRALDWAEDLDALAEYDRTGEYVSLEEALTEFEAGVEADLVARGK